MKEADKLDVMPRTTDRVWVLACTFALTVLLAVAYHAQIGRNAATGMSAPSSPRTSIDSAPLNQLLRTPFDSAVPNPSAVRYGFPIAATRVDQCVVRVCCLSWNYGPLHRRPPPRLS